MDGGLKQPTFIPKKPLTEPKKAKKKRSGGTGGIFFILGIIIFLLGVGLTAGTFLLKKVTENRVENKKVSLQRAKEAFEPELIEELSILSDRMDAANRLLDSHITATPFFELLEQLTLKSIRFTDFDYSLDPNDKVTISMSGTTDSFASVALQSDLFGANRYIQEPIFSDFGNDSLGNITFEFAGTVNQSLILYENTLNN